VPLNSLRELFMRDKSLGMLMFVVSVLVMIGYFFFLFSWIVLPKDILLLGKSLSEWALIIPVMIIVYAFLFIVAWVGWAMASTPPPLPVVQKNSEEKEETE
jgi:hypothetical protein